MFLEQLQLQNVLSYRAVTFDFQPVTAIIGANGSGKSNFLRAIELLQNTAGELSQVRWGTGGPKSWVFGFSNESTLELRAQFGSDWEYSIGLKPDNGTFVVAHEQGVALRGAGQEEVFQRNYSTTGVWNQGKETPAQSLKPQDTLLSRMQYGGREDIGQLVASIKGIRFYSVFDLDDRRPLRAGVGTSEMKDHLFKSGHNLALVLNEIAFRSRMEPINRYLKLLLPSFREVKVRLEASYATLSFQFAEFDEPVPAARLSDGTLSFLGLLVALFDPTPAPLICLEEPEKGLHPEAVTLLGKAILEASERTQIVLTTHSRDLVDAFSAKPEYVVTAEYAPGEGTALNRHTRADLEIWLDDYSLGDLWVRGQIGGNPQ